MNKKYFSVCLLTLASVWTFYACSKSFLNRKPIGQYTMETYYTDSSHALAGLVGVYDVIGWAATFDRMFWDLGDGATDDSPFGLQRDDGSPPYVGITPIPDYTNVKYAELSPAMQRLYQGHYEGIYRANLFISQLGKSSVSESVKNRFIAEAKSLRALHYFMLVNYYGTVPLYTEPVDPVDPKTKQLERSPVDAVYAQIEKDLTEALPFLPSKAQTASENMLGRVTIGAANALLAKVYLFEKKYPEAVSAAQAVIDGGEYDLNPDYHANFIQASANGIESVFEIQHNDNSTTDNGGGWSSDSFDGSSTPVEVQCGGWGQNAPSADLYSTFENGDIRRQYTCPTATDLIDGAAMCGTPAQPSMGKHIIPGTDISLQARPDVVPLNWVLIRYAEVLLIKAEALAAQASGTAPADAITALMKVRDRAGLTTPTESDFSAYSGQDFLRYVRLERRKELGMEAWRLFDLRRYGTDSLRNALIRVGKINTTDRPWDDKYMLFPIPQSEIDLSGGVVTQTPGY
jgi:hypothetical protein